MTHDFYALLGSLQSLLFYLYGPTPGDDSPKDFFKQLADGSLAPKESLYVDQFKTVQNFYLQAARESRSLALAVNELRTASRKLEEHPDFPNCSKRLLAAAAAQVSLTAAGSNNWFTAAIASAADAANPLTDFEGFKKRLIKLSRRGKKFEDNLLETAEKAQQLCINLRMGAEVFYRDLRPLVVSVREFDPELAHYLTGVLEQIKECFSIDGGGIGSGVWPSSYISSSSSGSNYYAD